MLETSATKRTAFFNELAHRFKREQIECATPENDRLPILLDGQEVGVITPGGGMLIRKEFADEPDAGDLYYRAGEIAAEIREYMNLMESAPPLKASGLDMPYKQLADFSGYVLGGVESTRGVQFTTWQWAYNKEGVTLGHYCGNDYDAAKEDFAIRCGMVRKQVFFTDEQLTEIYRCIQDTLDHQYDITCDQENLLKDTQEQIAGLVPDLQQRITEAQAQEDLGFSHQML